MTINQEQRYYEDGQLDRITDYTITYDSLGREVENLYTYWDDLAKTQSDNKSKSISTYTDDAVETTYYYYDKISGSFQIEYKDSTQSNHDVWVYKFYSYSEANEEFSLNSTYTYTFEYDENGNVAKSLSTVKRGSNEPKVDSETYFTHKIVTKKGGLGGGAIAGIVIGSIVLLFVGLFVVWKYELKKKAAKEGAKRILKFLDPVYKPIDDVLFNIKEDQK